MQISEQHTLVVFKKTCPIFCQQPIRFGFSSLPNTHPDRFETDHLHGSNSYTNRFQQISVTLFPYRFSPTGSSFASASINKENTFIIHEDLIHIGFVVYRIPGDMNFLGLVL